MGDDEKLANVILEARTNSVNITNITGRMQSSFNDLNTKIDHLPGEILKDVKLMFIEESRKLSKGLIEKIDLNAELCASKDSAQNDRITALEGSGNALKWYKRGAIGVVVTFIGFIKAKIITISF